MTAGLLDSARPWATTRPRVAESSTVPAKWHVAPTSDADGLRRGDPGAFDVVYSRYHARVYRFLLRLSRRRDVAQDLFQETWVKLARSSHRLHEDTDLAAWLFRVARNAWSSHARRAVLDVSRLVELDEDALPQPSVIDAEERVDASRSAERLDQALRSLRAASREVLLLVGVEGFDQERAAAILGISYEALRQRLSRARAVPVAIVVVVVGYLHWALRTACALYR